MGTFGPDYDSFVCLLSSCLRERAYGLNFFLSYLSGEEINYRLMVY